LSKKIEDLDKRLNLTQKQKELLRKTINRLEQDILRNTNKIEGIYEIKTKNTTMLEQFLNLIAISQIERRDRYS